MANNAQILTVSIPRTLSDFIETANLSPSAVFQDALMEKKEVWDKAHIETKRLIENIERLQLLLSTYVSYLELKGLNSEYLSWRNGVKLEHSKENAIL